MTPTHERSDPPGKDTTPSAVGDSRPPGPRTPRPRKLRWPLFLFPLLLIIGGGVERLIDDARHQVTGTVLDSRGQPIAGVRIAVPELDLDTRTDAAGRFNLYIPGSPQEVSLVATSAGLTTARQSVRSGTSGLRLTLPPR